MTDAPDSTTWGVEGRVVLSFTGILNLDLVDDGQLHTSRKITVMTDLQDVTWPIEIQEFLASRGWMVSLLPLANFSDRVELLVTQHAGIVGIRQDSKGMAVGPIVWASVAPDWDPELGLNESASWELFEKLFGSGPQIPSSRLAVRSALEDLDLAGQRVVDLIAENGRLRGILEAHGIDPDAPARAMAVFRDARGSNRLTLLVAAMTLVQTLFTVTGSLPSWFDEDSERVVQAAQVQCQQTITIVNEAPPEVFVTDDPGTVG